MSRRYTRPLTTPAAARAVRDYSRPFVSLLSDFGARDPSAAICKGVILAIAPEALVVDITHEVAKFQVRDGALLLWCALPYLPIGAHVAVVDPGVGTERLPIAVETVRGDVLVGPDNGLLIPAAERLGGIASAHVLDNPEYRLPIVSASFHGRDLFSPAAAHVSLGVPVHVLGRSLDPRSLVRLNWPQPQIGEGELGTGVIYVDTFGNLKLSAEPSQLTAALGPLSPGERLQLRVGAAARQAIPAIWVDTFGRVPTGDFLVYEDSYGRLCIAQNQGSAAERLGLAADARLWIARARAPARRRR
ncbi:MAG: SAM-dependent chlorinase/fluorinase [Chloroflexota bacterium]|nr:SAM-dependent chlorinase/fluorinase [Chloroflexota bacterium]